MFYYLVPIISMGRHVNVNKYQYQWILLRLYEVKPVPLVTCTYIWRYCQVLG